MPLQAAPGLARTEGRHIRGVIPGPIEANIHTIPPLRGQRHIRGVIPGPIEARSSVMAFFMPQASHPGSDPRPH